VWLLIPLPNTPLASTASDQEFHFERRTGVAVPRNNTVPQNRYDGKADDPLATDQIRSENQASAGVPRLEFYVPCHPQRRCKKHALRTRKGSYRSATEHDCRPGRFLRQVHFRIVQRPLDSAVICAGQLALSELWACSRHQQKNRLTRNPKHRSGPWLRPYCSCVGVGHTVRALESDESQQTGLLPPSNRQSLYRGCN